MSEFHRLKKDDIITIRSVRWKLLQFHSHHNNMAERMEEAKRLQEAGECCIFGRLEKMQREKAGREE